MKRILMYLYGDITTDARVNRAATALANGYDVTLISTDCGRSVNDNVYRNVLVGSVGTGLWNLLKNIMQAYRYVRRMKPDILYCHDYYSAILAFLCVDRRFFKRIVYDAHELIIPEPGLRNRRQSVFYWFEKQIINRVDLVVCANDERCRQMVNHYGLRHTPVVIRNISQLTVDENTNIDGMKDFFALPGQTVVYAGAVTRSRRVEELAKAVASLAPRFKLLVVGNGAAIDSIKQIVVAYPEMRAFFTGAVPYRALGAILSRCDIGFVYYPVDTLNNRFCASNKVYEYASVALPMISNENPTIKQELEQNHIGIASSDFKSAILELSEDLPSYKEACRQYTINNPWQKDADLLLASVNEIMK